MMPSKTCAFVILCGEEASMLGTFAPLGFSWFDFLFLFAYPVSQEDSETPLPTLSNTDRVA
jgi:hypothetical protein